MLGDEVFFRTYRKIIENGVTTGICVRWAVPSTASRVDIIGVLSIDLWDRTAHYAGRRGIVLAPVAAEPWRV